MARIIYIILVLFFTLNEVFSQPILYLTDRNKEVLSGKFISFWEDSSGTVDFTTARKQTYTNSKSDVIDFKVSTSAFWLKVIIVKNTSKEALIEIENPLINSVSVFISSNQKIVFTDSSSKNVPFYNRSIIHPNYRFTIPSGYLNDTLECFIRCESYAQLNLPINIGTYASFEDNPGKDFFSAMYFGLMAVMFLYNLFLFLTIWDRNYLYYSLYIISVALVQVNLKGIGFMYVWPNLPTFEKYAVFLFSPLTAFCSIAFIKQFISTKTFTPKLDKIYWVFIAIYTLIIVNAVVGVPQVSYNLLNAGAALLSFFMLYNAIVINKKFKYRPAMFFLVAWSVFLGSIILFVLKDVGVLAYTPVTASILQIGSAIEVTLLSFALADKINILKKEKETAQAEALNSARENERITKEQNVILEQKVVERTTELTETNNNLSVALNDLKQAQTQLVESEKMASLGQLTAGIAHEINNPINFVTSNIKPLERDINDLYTLQNETEKLLNDNEQAIQQIKKYKADIDFDYLKTEISFLLKGIHEGSSRTAEIVKGLRIFSRVDEDDIKLANINEGLDSTIIIVNNQLNNKIAIEKKYTNLPFVECYPGKLNQVFLNLISNAIYAVKQKFRENEGGKLIIKTEHIDNKAIITISDNGTGMSPETKHKLFEPFFTTKPVGEGTGLGLSITYNTIKKHNGTITVDSELGEGTTFKITIPIKQHNE